MGKNLILILTLSVIAYTFIILFGELLFLVPFNKSEWCESYDPKYDFFDYDTALASSGDSGFIAPTNSTEKVYENPDYILDPCRYERLPHLCWLTIEECDVSRRMLTSVLLGGAIGYERRASDRPAGIRTMGLVSLGSCFFTISSQLAFKSSTMGWDSSRVTAAIPSGVGFLGAGLIWKGTVGIGESEVHQVHGLTTAASVWLSAAVGVGCGGALYFPTAYATILVLMVLRYGPKMYLLEDSDSISDDEEDDDLSMTEDESSETELKQRKYETNRKVDDKFLDNHLKSSIDTGIPLRSKGRGESSSRTYNSIENTAEDKHNTSTRRKATGNVKLSADKMVTARFEDEFFDENVPLATSDDEMQQSLHVGFQESVEHIESMTDFQTLLKHPVPSEKKKKKGVLGKRIPNFHS